MGSPKLKDFPQYPVIAIVGLLAIAITLAWWSKVDVSYLLPNAEIRRGELWRLATPIFLHVDVFHLAFNLYWLWVFGTCIEKTFGHRITAALLCLFAIGSSSWEFALAQGGVGLSGVGYGLFGMLWVLSCRDERFRDIIDKNTIILFLAWFVACIAITLGIASLLVSDGQKVEWVIALLIGIATFFPTLRKRFGTIIFVIFLLFAFGIHNNGNSIGNVAHGAGLILGALTGCALSAPRHPKTIRITIACIICFGILGATILRPLINHSKYAGFEERKWCYDALKANQNEKAVWWCRDAVFYNLDNYDSLINVAIAYNRVGDKTRAGFFFHEAHEKSVDTRQ